MDGHRYADESKPSWYTGSQYSRSGDPEVSGSHARGGGPASAYESGIHERPSGAFRLPEQRPSGATYPPTDSLSTSGSHALPVEAEARIPVRGPEYPTIRPTPGEAPSTGMPYGGPPRSAPSALAAEPTALVPPVAAARPGEGVYQNRRSTSSYVVAAATVVLMIPAVRLLFQATFAAHPVAGSIVPAVLLTLGLPLTGVGLFALAGSGSVSRESWLRPPIAYLPAGLLLLLAAGLATA